MGWEVLSVRLLVLHTSINIHVYDMVMLVSIFVTGKQQSWRLLKCWYLPLRKSPFSHFCLSGSAISFHSHFIFFLILKWKVSEFWTAMFLLRMTDGYCFCLDYVCWKWRIFICFYPANTVRSPFFFINNILNVPKSTNGAVEKSENMADTTRSM